jgi:succinyl-CoA:acetate CoA-transferase
MPYQSDPVTRAKINAGTLDYLDMHLSHVAQMVREGFLGDLDIALIEVSGVTAGGALIPSSSVGNNAWIGLADRVILKVNSWQPAELDGMHDIYYGTALPPDRTPIQILRPSDRIGEPYLRCPADKIIAVVPTNDPGYPTPSRPADRDSRLIAGHVLDFLTQEVRQGRLPARLLPLQSGVGNVTNAVVAGLDSGPFAPLTAYTEVVQDGMLQLPRSDSMTVASATGFPLGEDGLAELRANIAAYRDKIIVRPQEISNHPEVVRRLGCLAMNGMIEADIYGNVNSTHVMGSSMCNGIGGSGDFARNAYFAMFLSPSTAKNGTISCIVPIVSHVDHTEHDVHVIITEQGIADLRGLPPRRRAQQVIDHCAHPDYRPALQDYLDRATATSPAGTLPTC